jgi:large subunit ribosomal protein L25
MLDWFLAYYTEEIRQFISAVMAFKKLGLHPNAHTVEIDLEKENHLTLFYKTFKFTQCLTRFYTLTFQIFDDKEITMEVPVKIIGNSKGVMAGGDLRLKCKLKVRALPKDLPDFVEADITPW